MNLIQGETVTVVTPSAERDELGEPVAGAPARTVVENVVVAPGPTSELDASRPEGVSVAYTLCFPKSFRGGLRGRTVEVRGETFRVVGDPKRYSVGNVPGPWDRTAEVVRADG